jgi:hypothetical protein
MVCMLQAAEEGQEAAAAAPSKAAEKRARKRAAARATATAAAAHLPAVELQDHGQSNSMAGDAAINDAAPAVADAAAELQRVSLAGGAALQAGPTAGGTSAAAPAADGGRQQHLQQQPAWMLCPITKVGTCCPAAWQMAQPYS